MTELALQKLAEELRNGNEARLDEVFLNAHQPCVAQLTKLTGSAADAEDLFMDAMWLFRGVLLKGKTPNAANINGYLFTIARNLFLKKTRDNEKWIHASADEKEVAQFLTKMANDTQEQEEFEFEGASEKEQRFAAVIQAFDSLGEQCRKLLEGFLLREIPLKDLQVPLGYNNYDTIRAAKYQCKKSLIEKFNRFYTAI